MASIHQARVAVGSNGVVNVHVDAETLYNLEATQELTRAILGRLGCPRCCSGRQFLFLQEEVEFTLPISPPSPGSGDPPPPTHRY
jgi:hypothetical protein